MARIDEIATALGGARRNGDGYLCRCPCHDDRTASLSLSPYQGSLRVNCFAGCRWEDVRAELERRGLIPRHQPQAAKIAGEERPKKNKYDGARFYTYTDIVGNILARKVKLPDKKMWIERFDPARKDWVSGLNGATLPLYNIVDVSKAEVVYLCEGEKDAQTLIDRGLVAATNHTGATSWQPHLTEQLAGKTVIIIPDNDEAGRKRVAIISKALHSKVKELRVFVPEGVPEKGDITDWVEAGGDVTQILPKSIVVEKKTESKTADREEYYELFEDVFNGPRKCIFNEKLMYQADVGGVWNPCINDLDIVRSEALVRNKGRSAKFQSSAIQPHFFAFERSKRPEFLPDIPEWDGESRISWLSRLVTLSPSSGVSVGAFEDLLKEWCALVFQRLWNPMIQNRILVLQGGQGIGKDTWTSMLVDGLGQFCIPLSVIKEDKDTYLNLHRGLIMKISEFDKTAKTEVSTLKDIITAPSTNLRAPYDKDSKLRLSRCSFISSANAENLLRDSTGNRRFMIFEIHHIEYLYAGWSLEEIQSFQGQTLAEMVYLAGEKYVASDASKAQMKSYIDKFTPTDPAEDMVEHFLVEIRKNLSIYSGSEIAVNDERVIDAITSVSKATGIKSRGIKSMLQSRIGTYRRVGEKRLWALKLPEITTAPDSSKGRLEDQGGLGLF